MIWIWAALVILLVMLLLALVAGLLRAAAREWDPPERGPIDERTAELLTRPDGNVVVLERRERDDPP